MTFNDQTEDLLDLKSVIIVISHVFTLQLVLKYEILILEFKKLIILLWKPIK